MLAEFLPSWKMQRETGYISDCFSIAREIFTFISSSLDDTVSSINRFMRHVGCGKLYIRLHI